MRPARLISIPVAWRLPDSRKESAVGSSVLRSLYFSEWNSATPSEVFVVEQLELAADLEVAALLERGVGDLALLLPASWPLSANW